MKILESATRIVLILLVVAVILLNVLGVEISDTLNTITISVISFYFGQKVVNPLQSEVK